MADLAFVQQKFDGGYDPRSSEYAATLDSSPTAGNLLWCSVVNLRGNANTYTTPDGWTYLATYTSIVSNGQTGLYYRVATIGEGKSVAVPHTANFFENWSLSISEWAGVDGSDLLSPLGTWIGTQVDNSALTQFLTATRSGTTPQLFLSWITFVNVDNRVATVGNGFSIHATTEQNKVEQAIAANYGTDLSGQAVAATWAWGAVTNRIECGIIGFNGSAGAPPAGTEQFRFDNTVFGGSQNFTVPIDEMPDYYPVGEEIGQDAHISHIGKAWLYDWWRRPKHSIEFRAISPETAANLGSLVSEEYGFLFYDMGGGTGTFLFDGPYRRRDYGPNMSEFSFNISRAD